MRRIIISLLLAGFVASRPAAPAAISQGQPAITIAVQAGFARAYRPSEWFPVVVDMANDGPDVSGVLEWDFLDQHDEATFRRTIDLPRGSRKRVTVPAFSRTPVQRGRVGLLDGNTTLAEQIIPLEAIDPQNFLIGVISSDSALLNSLASLSISTATNATVRHFDIAALPEDAAPLRSLNALFIHDVDTAALTRSQRDALALWVSLGGQLVVSGGLNVQKTTAGLTDLMPADLTGTIIQGDLAPLARFAREQPPETTAAALSEARPRAGVEQLPPGTELLFRRQLGEGTVTFSAFDLASLRGWAGEARLWRELLTPILIFAPGTNVRTQQNNPLQDVLRLPQLGLPSLGTLLAFLLAYILIVGPLNYLLLRWLHRLEWAWLTIPLTVLIFAGGLYVVGAGLRGGRPQVDQVAVVQAVEGQPRGYATAFVSLFSARRANYTLSFSPDTLVSEASGARDSAGAQVIRSDADVEVRSVLVDVGAVRTFMAETAVDMPVSIQSDVRTDGGLRGEIRNTGAKPLDDVMIVHGGLFQQLGRIAPGESQRITEPSVSNRFPWSVELSQLGPFNRQNLLSSLFGNARLRSSSSNIAGDILDKRAVYLLAWSDQPTISERLDGQTAAQEGLTLYVFRLQTNG